MTGLNTAAIKIKTNFGTLDDVFYMSTIARLLVLSVLTYSVLYAPVLIGAFIYKKQYESFQTVAKPYWKVFLTYVAGMGLISISSILVVMDYSAVGLGDIVYLIFILLKIIFVLGYAYNLKIGKQILWKILGVPLLLIAFTEPFICSESFLYLTGQHILFDSYSGVVWEFLINLAVFYALYRYAFKDDVYKVK